MVDPRAVIGDQAQAITGLGQDGRVDAVGDRRHQNVRIGDGGDQLRLGHRLVVQVQLHVEQFHHAGFDGVGQFARDDDAGLFIGHGRSVSVHRGHSNLS